MPSGSGEERAPNPGAVFDVHGRDILQSLADDGNVSPGTAVGVV